MGRFEFLVMAALISSCSGASSASTMMMPSSPITTRMLPRRLHLDRLLGVRMIMAALPQRPLASFDALIPTAVLAQHVQLVLTDRSDLSQGKEFAVFSPKHGGSPISARSTPSCWLGLVGAACLFGIFERDIADGRLVEIKLEDLPTDSYILGMSAAYRADKPPEDRQAAGPSGPVAHRPVEGRRRTTTPSDRT
jgi:hypothetical protein